jgi:hypothetical protein
MAGFWTSHAIDTTELVWRFDQKLRLPLSNFKKYKTMDTQKTVNIFELTFRPTCSHDDDCKL